MAMSEQGATFREQTLATRYQPRQRLPPNFNAVLKEYAREVLRAQPEDILGWSAEYFKRLALDKDPMQAHQPPADHYTPVVEDPDLEVLAQRTVKVFASMDSENKGVLYTQLIQRALQEGFGLTRSQALYILTSEYVVIRDDDTIAYAPLARNCVRAVQFFQQTKHEFAVTNVEHATVHGLNRSDVERSFLMFFRLIDEAGIGRLPFAQYRDALANAPYHLTRRDIQMLSLICKRSSSSDEVEYEKEVQNMFEELLLAEQFELFDEEDDGEPDAK